MARLPLRAPLRGAGAGAGTRGSSGWTSGRPCGGPPHRRGPGAPGPPAAHATGRGEVVLIADVSGSMEPYSRASTCTCCTAPCAAPAEAFVFATRLTRLTRALARRSPDVA